MGLRSYRGFRRNHIDNQYAGEQYCYEFHGIPFQRRKAHSPAKHIRTKRKIAGKLSGSVGRIPRISKLMALAIRFDGLIRDGEVYDMSELARLAHVTQPRMTQIMNLLHLAPDIQEEILFLPEVTKDRDRIHEHMLRSLTAILRWDEQRRVWAAIRSEAIHDT